MADKQPTMPPQSEPFPGSRTPGWNDPPTLQYDPSSVGPGAGRTRLNLNKRVAFPLQGTVGSASIAGGASPKPTAIVPPNQASFGSGLLPTMSLPSTVGSGAGTSQPIAVVHPMPNMHAPPPVSRLSTVPAATESVARTSVTSVNVLPADALQSTFHALRAEAPEVRESPNVRREEIERRLGIIEQLWESGNLSAPVQEQLYKLGRAIAEKNYSRAMETYTTLVTSHGNECASWSVALRHIVLTLQPTTEPDTDGTATSNTSTIAISESTSNSSSSSNIAIVPAMFVPAMPRHQTEAASVVNISGAARTTTTTTVQHI